ncbi:MAG: S1/P1 Nuclease [Ignavibacteriales bacterium]|nr:S1/P1 Nuclease [Ignavibacteriales bacterium]
MKRILSTLTLVIALPLFSSVTLSWGFWAHKEIHRYAIQSLPSEMRPFFEDYGDSIIARSVDADRRRNVDKNEGPYHYIDIDRYGKYPFEELPRNYDDAVKKFGKEMVDTNGTVPWRIASFTERLTDAMKRKDRRSMLFHVANLGHYIADAHVPLHSTENYDGKMTNQAGLHSRWESQLPERFGGDYKLAPATAEHIEDPLATAFDVVLESFERVDSVLRLDLKAKEGIPESELVTTKRERGRTVYLYSDKYYERYHALLNGMVERRLNDAVRRVASYWYTAWVNAGKPDLVN